MTPPVPPPVTPVPAAVAESPAEPPHRSPIVYFILVPLLVLFAVWLLLAQEWSVFAEITLTVAVLILVFALRGPVRRRGRWTRISLIALALLAAPVDLVLIFDGIDDSVNSIGEMLFHLILFIVYVGALTWLTASWGKVVVAEVSALLIIAAMLGFVSFSGISYFTTPVSAPEPDNALMVVLAADPAAQMHVGVTYRPRDEAGSTTVIVSVDIWATDPRWAIFVSRGLKFDSRGIGSGVTLTELSGIQMLSNERDARSSYSGRVIGKFQESSASRSVVSLPEITSESPNTIHADIQSATGYSAVPPRSLAISVDCGRLSPLKTVTQAAPPLAVPTQLTWEAHRRLGPIAYATFDQAEEDRSRNFLFIIAILLGAAVACLVASLQVLLKAAGLPAGSGDPR